MCFGINNRIGKGNGKMNNEELLKKLGEVAKEDASEYDGKWDLLAAGELTEEEVEKLKQSVPDIEKSNRAFEAFKPLDSKFKSNVVENLLENKQKEIKRAQINVDEVSRIVKIDSIVKEKEKSLLDKISEFFTIKTLSFSAACGAAAIIAVIIVYPSSDFTPLPDYSITVNRGIQEFRGEKQPEQTKNKIPEYKNGSLFELIIRPSQTIEKNVKAEVYFEDKAGSEFIQVPIPIKYDPKGSIRISGIVGKDLKLKPGKWSAWVAIGYSNYNYQVKDIKKLFDNTEKSKDEKQKRIILKSEFIIN